MRHLAYVMLHRIIEAEGRRRREREREKKEEEEEEKENRLAIEGSTLADNENEHDGNNKTLKDSTKNIVDDEAMETDAVETNPTVNEALAEGSNKSNAKTGLTLKVNVTKAEDENMEEEEKSQAEDDEIKKKLESAEAIARNFSVSSKSYLVVIIL